MTKEEIIKSLTKKGTERFNEAVKLFSAQGLLSKVKFTAKIIVLKNGDEVTLKELA